jgi:hypothetical protein
MLLLLLLLLLMLLQLVRVRVKVGVRMALLELATKGCHSCSWGRCIGMLPGA